MTVRSSFGQFLDCIRRGLIKLIRGGRSRRNWANSRPTRFKPRAGRARDQRKSMAAGSDLTVASSTRLWFVVGSAVAIFFGAADGDSLVATSVDLPPNNPSVSIRELRSRSDFTARNAGPSDFFDRSFSSRPNHGMREVLSICMLLLPTAQPAITVKDPIPSHRMQIRVSRRPGSDVIASPHKFCGSRRTASRAFNSKAGLITRNADRGKIEIVSIPSKRQAAGGIRACRRGSV